MTPCIRIYSRARLTAQQVSSHIMVPTRVQILPNRGRRSILLPPGHQPCCALNDRFKGLLKRLEASLHDKSNVVGELQMRRAKSIYQFANVWSPDCVFPARTYVLPKHCRETLTAVKGSTHYSNHTIVNTKCHISFNEFFESVCEDLWGKFEWYTEYIRRGCLRHCN
jgi:hypothetical protein